MVNVSGRILFLTLAGIAAGILTWGLADLSGLVHLADTGGALTTAQAQQQAIVCAFFGAMIGLLLGLADMIASGMGAQWLRITGYGLLLGAVAGFVGIAFGGTLYSAFHTETVTNPFDFLRNTFARALGWAFIGALAGSADGVRKWSGRTIRNGMVGGFIGGLIGGTVFEASVYLFGWVPRPAVISRLFGFTITGGLIGLFIGLVQQLLKEAWVRIVVGKNEGREVLIDKTESTVGRSELCDIALFGDMSVAKNHAVISASPNGGYVLRDVSGKPGTVSVNDKKVVADAPAPIRNGDTIRIGNKTLLFFERFTKERTATVRDGRVPPLPPAPFPPSEGEKRGVSGTVDVGLAAKPNDSGARTPPFSISDGERGRGGEGSPRLVATTGPHAGQTFALRSGAVIGRDPNADIALPNDTSASRRHAKIVQEALSLAVEDTGSTNGTFVNGQRITRQSLVPGDTVLIGGTSLTLE